MLPILDCDVIVQALLQSGGKLFGQGGAAEILGVKPTTLASRIKRWGSRRRNREAFGRWCARSQMNQW